MELVPKTASYVSWRCGAVAMVNHTAVAAELAAEGDDHSGGHGHGASGSDAVGKESAASVLRIMSNFLLQSDCLVQIGAKPTKFYGGSCLPRTSLARYCFDFG